MNGQGQITTTYLNFSYSYMVGSNQTQLLQSVTLLDPIGHANSYTRNYTYDTMNRLTNAEVMNSSHQEVENWGYSYDKAGNRLTSSVFSTGKTTNYTYNAAEELTKTVQGSTTLTFNYVGNGNLTGSSGGLSLSYNIKNQTTAINSNSYTYSGPDQTERVALNGTTDAYSGLGLSYETTSGSTTYYYLFDGLGSIVGLTNSSSSEVNAYDYDPYGNVLHETSGVANPWQYAGGYFESSTGFVKFGTRYYDSAWGRWIQQDLVAGSLGSPDSLNRYLYAKDNPVNVVDLSGRDIITCALTFGVAFAAIVVGAAIFIYLAIIVGGGTIIGAELGLLLALIQGACS